MFLGIDIHEREAQVAVRNDDGDVIEQPDDRIEERAEEMRETRLLMTIPGIVHYSALVIYAEIGEIDRFDTAKEVVRCRVEPDDPQVPRLADRGKHLEEGLRKGPVDACPSSPLSGSYGR
jgi:hypothetical protein